MNDLVSAPEFPVIKFGLNRVFEKGRAAGWPGLERIVRTPYAIFSFKPSLATQL
jgi:hypothetical protein